MNDLMTSNESLKGFEYCGGKAHNMKKMWDAEIKVPPFMAISDNFLQDYIKKTQITIIESEDLKQIESKALEIFEQTPLPNEMEESLIETLQTENLYGYELAVRSSGLEEDSKDHSFAGLFSSFLFQKTREDISLSLRRCWASAYSERALAYRKQNGLPLTSIRMGVVIQRMINSEKAGVAFSKNPINPIDRESIIVEGVFGQGEGLVSGALEADQFMVKLNSKQVESRKAEKEEYFSFKESGPGLEIKKIEGNQKNEFVLSDEEAIEVAQATLRIEQYNNFPMDIEWASEKGSLYILQMRPITTLPPQGLFDKAANGEDPILWDNSNIIESFSGVTTPLTFSATKKAYEIVYRETCRVMGVPERVILDYADSFENMLGFIRGRVYYNLINWYKLLFLLPGASSNQGFMEIMMGVKEDLNEEQQELFKFVEQLPKYSSWQKLKVLALMLYRFARINSITIEFFSNFDKNYKAYRLINFKEQSLSTLLKLYNGWQERITYRWKAPIINDFRCMLFFGTLKKLTENWINLGEDSVEGLQNDLLCGEGDLESTMPTKTMMKIASNIDRNRATTRELFANNPTNVVLKRLRTEEQFKETSDEFNDYLEKYGFRCINEQKLEEKDLQEDPTFAINAIQNYIRTHSYSIDSMAERERAIRNKAEKKVFSQMFGPKKWFYRFILGQARHAVKNRENLRFARTKSFGVMRKLFRAMDQHLLSLGVIQEKGDLFYLSLDEVEGLIKGAPLSVELDPIIQIRKKEYQEYRDTPDPPDRFITKGVPGALYKYSMVLSQLDLLKDKMPISDDPNLFYGISCCPGVVEKTVRIAKSIEDTQDLNGEILITYRTDPGWVPLYPSCSGLIIERGSLLSHSAVVARELGLPTIVGVNGKIVDNLQTGDKVLLNATKGEITVLERMN